MLKTMIIRIFIMGKVLKNMKSLIRMKRNRYKYLRNIECSN